MRKKKQPATSKLYFLKTIGFGCLQNASESSSAVTEPPAQFRSPKRPLSSPEDQEKRKYHMDFTANQWHLKPDIGTQTALHYYHTHWLLTHRRLRRLKERAVLLNKDFSGDLKKPIDLQQLTMIQTHWADNLDAVTAKMRHHEMRSCAK